MSPDGTHVFVADDPGACGVSGSVSVVDTSRETVVADIPVTGVPTGLAINALGTRVYAASVPIVGGSAASVSVIDTTTNTLTSQIEIGGAAIGIAINADGSRVYVANGIGLQVIDTASNSISATLDLGGSPYAVALTPDSTRAYVTLLEAAQVTVVDTATYAVITRITIPAPRAFGQFIGPEAIATPTPTPTPTRTPPPTQRMGSGSGCMLAPGPRSQGGLVALLVPLLWLVKWRRQQRAGAR